MKLNLFVIFGTIFLCFVVNCVNSQFPSDVKRCKYSDEKCFTAEFNRLIETQTEGHKELGLVGLNPLKINSIDIKQGGNSPVKIDLNFNKCGIYGIPDLRLYKAKGFGKDLKGPHEFHVKGPSLALIGDYKVNGHVLILPISGSGPSNMTLVNPKIIIHFDAKPVERNGKTYMEIGKLVLRIKMDRLWMQYSNLFNGDKALGDNMNLFLNDNWKDIWGELEDTVLQAFELVFKNILQNIFFKFPYDDFFVE